MSVDSHNPIVYLGDHLSEQQKADLTNHNADFLSNEQIRNVTLHMWVSYQVSNADLPASPQPGIVVIGRRVGTTTEAVRVTLALSGGALTEGAHNIVIPDWVGGLAVGWYDVEVRILKDTNNEATGYWAQTTFSNKFQVIETP